MPCKEHVLVRCLPSKWARGAAASSLSDASFSSPSSWWSSALSSRQASRQWSRKTWPKVADFPVGWNHPIWTKPHFLEHHLYAWPLQFWLVTSHLQREHHHRQRQHHHRHRTDIISMNNHNWRHWMSSFVDSSFVDQVPTCPPLTTVWKPYSYSYHTQYFSTPHSRGLPRLSNCHTMKSRIVSTQCFYTLPCPYLYHTLQ